MKLLHLAREQNAIQKKILTWIFTLCSLFWTGNMQEGFEEFDLPFLVDIIVWDCCSDSFKKSIQDSLFFPEFVLILKLYQ
jgi:hypothetical protein